MPSCVPPHKGAEADPGPEHRLRMCELAVAGIAGLEACPLEVQRGGPSYTVDTLLSLHASHPKASLTLILGSDIARTLPSWHRPQEILALADVALAARAGDAPGEVLEALDALRPSGDSGTDPAPAALPPALLELPEIPISSSLVRARVGAGESLDGLVPPAVAAYIAEHALYTAGDAAEVHAR